MNFPDNFFFEKQISKLIEIRELGADLFHADKCKDGRDEANSRFSQFLRKASRWNSGRKNVFPLFNQPFAFSQTQYFRPHNTHCFDFMYWFDIVYSVLFDLIKLFIRDTHKYTSIFKTVSIHKGAHFRVLNEKCDEYCVRNPYFLQYNDRFRNYLIFRP